MKKLQSAQSYVYSIMDKLGPVREAVAQKDDNWEERGLEELVENLRKYTDRNPLPEASVQIHEAKKPGANQGNHLRGGDKMLMSGSNGQQPRQPPPPAACVYCNSHHQRSLECSKTLEFASRREFLKTNCLCHNCASPGHATSQCRSRGCGRCNSRHHRSVCDRTPTTLPPNPAAESVASSDEFYGASYKVRVESNVIEDFGMELECINAEKLVLTYLPNPKIPDPKQRNHRIRRLEIS